MIDVFGHWDRFPRPQIAPVEQGHQKDGRERERDRKDGPGHHGGKIVRSDVVALVQVKDAPKHVAQAEDTEDGDEHVDLLLEDLFLIVEDVRYNFLNQINSTLTTMA